MYEKNYADKTDLLPKSPRAKFIIGTLALAFSVAVIFQTTNNARNVNYIGNVTCEGNMPIQAQGGDSIYDIADEHAERLNLDLNEEDTISFHSIIIDRTDEKILSQNMNIDGKDLVLSEDAELNLPTKCS
ncbi:hypothetical protein KA043_02675 [Candidatus Saccharibacteria bacterium]|nr:hypothetical protein [Candidatus Saccharibacteria bacterium]